MFISGIDKIFAVAINDAMFTGVENILSAYERLSQTPFYSVWKGKDLLFQFNEDDPQKGAVFLRENLEAAKENQNRDILKIKIHPKKEKTFITDAAPSIATLYVRVCEWNPQQYVAQQNAIVGGYQEKIVQLLETMNNRLTVLEEEAEEEEDTQIDTINGVVDTISGLLDKPIMNKLFDKLFGGNNVNAQPTLSGVPDNEKFKAAIELLTIKDEHFESDMIKLAEIAEKKPLAFKMLIAELREFKI